MATLEPYTSITGSLESRMSTVALISFSESPVVWITLSKVKLEAISLILSEHLRPRDMSSWMIPLIRTDSEPSFSNRGRVAKVAIFVGRESATINSHPFLAARLTKVPATGFSSVMSDPIRNIRLAFSNSAMVLLRPAAAKGEARLLVPMPARKSFCIRKRASLVDLAEQIPATASGPSASVISFILEATRSSASSHDASLSFPFSLIMGTVKRSGLCTKS